MIAPASPSLVQSLQEGDHIRLGGTDAVIVEVGADAVILRFVELAADVTEAAHDVELVAPAVAWPSLPAPEAGTLRLSHAEIAAALSDGQLVVADASPADEPLEEDLRYVLAGLSADSSARLLPRILFVWVTLALAEKTGAKASRGWIDKNRPLIYQDYLEAVQVEEDRKRSDAGLRSHAAATLPPDTRSRAPCSKSIFDDIRKFKLNGPAGLLDLCHRRGNRAGPYKVEAKEFIAEALRQTLDQQRPYKGQLVNEVRRLFRKENRKRQEADPPQPPLVGHARDDGLGRDIIVHQLARLGLLEYAVRTRGDGGGLRTCQPIGEGPQVYRALQRVLLDEWQIDVKTLLSELGIWDALTAKQQQRWIKKGKPRRLWLSAAIDLRTMTVLAVQFALAPDPNLTLRVLEMILMDKEPWAAGAGCSSPWAMRGTPEVIVMDRGPAYDNEAVYLAVARLGITYQGAVAGLAHLRAGIERFFLTLIQRVMHRLPGRTFSNPTQRGDYDSDAHAVLTDDEVITTLVRWIVDVHHNTPLDSLGWKSPRQAWDEAMRTEFGVRPSPSRRVMTMVFGSPEQRVLTNQGIEMMDIVYQSEALANLYMTGHKRSYVIRWWPQDVGAIEVCVGGDDWLTVEAREEGLAGKSIDEARPVVMQRRPVEDPAIVRIRDDALEAIEGVSPRALLQRRSFQASWPPERIAQVRARQVRHLQTSEGIRRRGPALGLLDDVVEPFPGSNIENRNSPEQSSDIRNIPDMME